jgi:Domain of unknown function (DUF4873)
VTHEPGESFSGAAQIVDGEDHVDVTVDLRGGLQPIDGHFHWYGRVRGAQRLASGDRVTLHTEYGAAEGRLSDVDPWGRLRIAGTGRPPF